MKRALGLLVLLGCGKGKEAPADAAVDAPAASAVVDASAAVDAATKPGPTYATYGSAGKAKQAFKIAIARDGDDLRAILDTGVRLPLTGKMTDATHFALKATKVIHGQKTSTLKGTLVPFDATFTDGDGKPEKLTAPGPATLPAKFQATLFGTLGKNFVRMKLTADGGKLTGVYRYAASASDLQLTGTVNADGTFALAESSGGKPTGKFAGILASPAALVGQWSSVDGARTYPFTAEEGDSYPESAAFDGGITLFPQEKILTGKRCRTDVVFPQLKGASGLKALNDSLRNETSKEKTCEGPDPTDDLPDWETSEGYALDTEGGRFIGLREQGYSYAGGAHGNYGSNCSVIDVKALQRFGLASKLTPAGAKKLAAMVTADLVKQNDGAKLSENGFWKDDVEITPDTDICLGPTWIEVSFDPYEIASYANGPQLSRFPKADVKDLFVKDDATKAMFP